MSLKEEVRKIANKLKSIDEDIEVSLFESSDNLQTLITSGTPENGYDNGMSGDVGGFTYSGGGGASMKGKGSTNTEDLGGGHGEGGDDQPEPIIDDNAPMGSGEGDGEGKDGDNQTIRVGTKVKIKATGRDGVVTAVNPDGTYTIGEVGVTIDDSGAEFELGGLVARAMSDTTGEVEVIGTFTGDEIEVVSQNDGGGGDAEGEGKPGKGKGGKPGKGKGGEPSEGGEPGSEGGEPGSEGEGQNGRPNLPDIESMIVRLEEIKQHVFKFPRFAKVFFDADIRDTLFYTYKARLALLNRLAKDVLKYRDPMPLEEARIYLDGFYLNYGKHQEFLMVNVDNSFIIKTTNPDNGMGMSIEMMEGILEQASIEFADENTADDVIQARLMLVMGIESALRDLEAVIIRDNDYYRILSLTAFNSPDMFGNNWLKPHLDFIFDFYHVFKLCFSNLQPNLCFQGTNLIDDDISYNVALLRGDGLTTYNTFRVPRNDTYTIYASKNVLAGRNDEKASLRRGDLKDMYGDVSDDISNQLMSFYRYALELQNNYNNKQITLLNLQKLSNLQIVSTKPFLIDTITLINIKYGL